MKNYNLVLKGAYVEITSICNLNCPYCYNNSNIQGKELSLSIIKQIIDELAENKEFAIAISGGEPFLHSKIFEIIDYCVLKNVKPNIISNLTAVDERRLKRVISLGASIQITFDGPSELIHGFTRGIKSYKKNIKILEDANNNNFINQINVRYNISKNNYLYLEEFILMMRKFNVHSISFSFIKNTGRAKEWNFVFDFEEDISLLRDITYTLRELKKQYNDIDISYGEPEECLGCAYYAMGSIDCVPRVDSNGNVYICQLFDGNENILGNVYNEKLSKIIKSNETHTFMNRLRNRIYNKNKKCDNCFLKSVCLGGCPAIIYANKNSLNENDSQCYMIKYFIKEKILNLKGNINE